MDRKWQLPPENRHGLSMKPLSIKVGHVFNKNSTIYILSTFFKASTGRKKGIFKQAASVVGSFLLHNTWPAQY